MSLPALMAAKGTPEPVLAKLRILKDKATGRRLFFSPGPATQGEKMLTRARQRN